MGLSNLVAFAIILTAAATLHVAGKADVDSAQTATEALRPIAGEFASFVFALGIVGTGLMAVPVLAGSAAYAIGEAFRWPVGLARRPKEARAFYDAGGRNGRRHSTQFSVLRPNAGAVLERGHQGIAVAPIIAVMMNLASSRR